MVRIIMKIIYLKKNINIWKESEKGKECREMLAEWNWQERKEKSIMTERKRVRRSGEGDLKLLHKLYNVKIIIVCKVEKNHPFLFIDNWHGVIAWREVTIVLCEIKRGLHPVWISREVWAGHHYDRKPVQ